MWTGSALFIDNGSLVTVKSDFMRVELRGRFGRVAKIRIVAHTGDVVVFVNLFNHATGGDDLMMFDPCHLQPRINKPAALKMPRATNELHAIRFAELVDA